MCVCVYVCVCVCVCVCVLLAVVNLLLLLYGDGYLVEKIKNILDILQFPVKCSW